MKDFFGKIGQTIKDSYPWWPEIQNKDSNLPNILTIVFDDTGWADFGCFGSEIKTPNIDALSKIGLRYTNFHVTPLCSPTRACMLTGLNHHKVGMRNLSDTDTGFPNSRGTIRKDVPLLSERLREEGYGTYMLGKWHLAPAHELTPAGPYENWPISRGFERYYGFLGGCTDQYLPELVQDNHMIDPPIKPGYHLSEDMVEKAKTYLQDHKAFRNNTPFFLNFCFGATHAPIQVDKKYIDPYVSIFEKGWDQTRKDRLRKQKEMGLLPANTDLVPRNSQVKSWDKLNNDERTLYTRLQAAYAGFLEHSDEQIGKLIDELKRLNLFNNTIILVMADNGSSPEGGEHGAVDVNAPYGRAPEKVSDMIDRLDDIGGPKGPAHYPEGWAVAGNTPFRRYKQWVELGGVRSPLVVSWPDGINDPGQYRDQFLHVVDLAPTLMELSGKNITNEFDGSSFLATFHDKAAESPRNTQYWEMFGRRALYSNGWKAVSEHEKGDDYKDDKWFLYNTKEDFSECHDLALKYPIKLSEMKNLWWQEAKKNEVLPLDDRSIIDIIDFRQPNGLMSKKEITLYPNQGHLPQMSMITSTERSMKLTIYFQNYSFGDEGVLISSGENLGGYSLYILKNKLFFEHVRMGNRINVSGELSENHNQCSLALDVQFDFSAKVSLTSNGDKIGKGIIPRISNHLSFWGMDVGRDAVKRVSNNYSSEFLFPKHKIEKIVINFFEDLSSEKLASAIKYSE